MKKAKVLVLLSGGLDSRVACLLLKEQADVRAVFLKLPFISEKEEERAKEFAEKEKIVLHIVDCCKGKLLKDYLKVIAKPKHGRGSGCNPCIDCKVFMLKEAGKIAKKIKADVIATGDVLGERPFSQNKRAFELIERKSGLKGELLRPLSAKRLLPVIAEKSGLIDREKLLNLEGRRRRVQREIVGKKEDNPNSAGGCLLCEKDFCRKVRDLLENKRIGDITERDVKLLRIGRHFRVGKNKIISGRNEGENNILKKERGIKISAGIKSPTTLIFGKANKKVRKIAEGITVRFSDYKKAKINRKIVKPINKKEMERYRI